MQLLDAPLAGNDADLETYSQIAGVHRTGDEDDLRTQPLIGVSGGGIVGQQLMCR